MDLFFEFADEEPLCTVNHIAVYSGIINLASKKKGSKIILPNTFSSSVKVTRRNTFSKVLKDLEEWGFLRIVQRSSNQNVPNIVSINKSRCITSDTATIQRPNSAVSPVIQRRYSDDTATTQRNAEIGAETHFFDNKKIIIEEKSEKTQPKKNNSGKGYSSIENNPKKNIINSEAINNNIIYNNILNNNINNSNSAREEEPKKIDFQQNEELNFVQPDLEPKKQKKKKSPAKKKSYEEYSIVHKIKIAVLEFDPQRSWASSDARNAKGLAQRVSQKLRAMHQGDPTDDEVIASVNWLLKNIHLSKFWGDKWDMQVLNNKFETIYAEIQQIEKSGVNGSNPPVKTAAQLVKEMIRNGKNNP